VLSALNKHRFLFEELVKRDFNRKYKGSFLGAAWSVLKPLLSLLIMRFIFGHFFGSAIPHFTTYLFCGNIVFSFFSESSAEGLMALYGNAHIFTKVNVPKYLFLFSINIQVLINFTLTLLVFFAFCALDHVSFSWRFLLLVYPVMTLLLFNVGIGMILSALFVFFRDIDYLWSVLVQLIMYGSAVFYTIDKFPPALQLAFSLNPVYRHIAYIREIVLAGTVPSVGSHLTLLGFAVAAFLAGSFMYKHYNTKFLYYV
jgi:ABC-2 type transport system permease protein